MTKPTALPWSMEPNGKEDSQGNSLFNIVSKSADLIVARDVWEVDAKLFLTAMSVIYGPVSPEDDCPVASFPNDPIKHRDAGNGCGYCKRPMIRNVEDRHEQ